MPSKTVSYSDSERKKLCHKEISHQYIGYIYTHKNISARMLYTIQLYLANLSECFVQNSSFTLLYNGINMILENDNNKKKTQ